MRMKLHRFIKMCLNETVFRYNSCSAESETRTGFIVVAFQICFRIFHSEKPRNAGGIEWNGTHQLPTCVDYGNLLTLNVHILKNTHDLSVGSRAFQRFFRAGTPKIFFSHSEEALHMKNCTCFWRRKLLRGVSGKRAQFRIMKWLPLCAFSS